MPIKTVREIDDALRRRFLNRLSERLRLRAFGTGENADGAEAFSFRMTLGRVSQREAAGSLVALREAARSWRAALEERPGWSLEESDLAIRALRATITLPAAVVPESDEALIAALAPDGWSVPEWREALERLRETARRFPAASTAPDRAADFVSAMKSTGVLRSSRLSNEDFERLLSLLAWLRAHPASGLFVREIPLEGIDSKWFERHRRALAALWCALFDEAFAPTDFAAAVGLRTQPKYVRIRHAAPWFGDGSPTGSYDPERDALMVTIEQLARRAPASRTVLIVENEQTGLSLTAPRDIPILIGMGYGVAALEEIPWLSDTRILYFGDLDTHGLAILAECRKRFPQTESLLMDQATFDRFRPLAVTEARQAGPLPEALNESEAALYAELLRTQGRLEQERIPLEAVNAAISLALERT